MCCALRKVQYCQGGLVGWVTRCTDKQWVQGWLGKKVVDDTLFATWLPNISGFSRRVFFHQRTIWVGNILDKTASLVKHQKTVEKYWVYDWCISWAWASRPMLPASWISFCNGAFHYRTVSLIPLLDWPQHRHIFILVSDWPNARQPSN
jgi:hypothetical protein